MERDQLKKIIAAFPVQASTVSKIDSNLYKLGGKRSYCLKYYPNDRQLDEMTVILHHLQKTGFQQCYQLLSTRARKPYLKLSSQDGGWQLTTWIPGKNPDFHNRKQLMKAIKLLANFHQHAKQVPFSNHSEGRYNTILKQWERKLENLQEWKKQYSHQAIAKAVELGENSLHVLCKGPVNDLIEREKKLQTVVHGDYNYPNLILTRNDRLKMIDFENAAHDIRIHDLVHIIQRNVYTDIDKSKMLLRVYEKERPLTNAERAVVSALISFPYQFWRLIHIRRVHRSSVTKNLLDRWGKNYLSRRYSAYWYRQS